MVSEGVLGKFCPGMAKELKEYQVGKFLIKSDTYQLRVCRLGMFYPSWKAQLQVGTNISIRKHFLISKRIYNLCNPFKYDLRCASLCGVEFVFTKERRENGAQRRSYFKGLQRLLVLDFSRVDFNGQSTRKPELGDIKDRSIELPL